MSEVAEDEHAGLNGHDTSGPSSDHHPATVANGYGAIDLEVGEDHDEDEDDLRWGFWSCKPHALQCCNTPIWAAIWLCLLAFVQGFVANGVTNVDTTALERRYGLHSQQVGTIISSYDMAAALFVLPITFFGTFGHQPRILAFGTLVMCLGAFVMVIPHFATGPYDLGSQTAEICDLSANSSLLCGTGGGSVSNYRFVFMLGEFMLGFGGSALYTLGIVYVDSNVKTRQSPFYQSALITAGTAGPALGYLLGGYFLDFYVDFDQDSDVVLLISSTDVRWVGAWWVGFIGGGAALAVLAIAIFPYPKIMPAGMEAKKERISQAHDDGTEEVFSRPGFFTSWRDVPVAIKLLVCNPVLMLVTFASVTEGMLLTGIAAFLPKIIQNQFSQTATWSAMLAGFVGVPGGVIGTMVGGVLTMVFDLKIVGMLRLAIGMALGGMFFIWSIVLHCEMADLAGVSAHYLSNDSHSDTYLMPPSSLSLDSWCNAGCGCSSHAYEPVCGTDGIQYFSACHAGCTESDSSSGTELYEHCSCIPPEVDGNQTTHKASAGPCVEECKLLQIFVILLFLGMLLTFAVVVPGINIILRCIPDSQRAFGLGINAVLYRCLGSIPGPILFGYVFDHTCLVWQENCEQEQGSCWIYDNRKLSSNLLILTLVIKTATITFLALALFFYKPPPDGSDTQSDTKDILSENELQQVDDLNSSDK